jgi:hypothetical protein
MEASGIGQRPSGAASASKRCAADLRRSLRPIRDAVRRQAARILRALTDEEQEK